MLKLKQKTQRSIHSVSVITLREIRQLIRQQLLRESSSEEVLHRRFLEGSDGVKDHVEAWVRLFLEPIFAGEDLIHSSSTWNNIVQAINQDVEDNEWLEYDLGVEIMKEPGERFAALLFSLLEKMIIRGDVKVNSIQQIMTQNDGGKLEKGFSLYPDSPRDNSALSKIHNYLTDAVMANLPNAEYTKYSSKNRYHVNLNDEDPMVRKIERATVKAAYECLLRWCNADRPLIKWYSEGFLADVPGHLRRGAGITRNATDADLIINNVSKEIGESVEDLQRTYSFTYTEIVYDVVRKVNNINKSLVYGDETIQLMDQHMRQHVMALYEPIEKDYTDDDAAGKNRWDTHYTYNYRVVDVPHDTRVIDAIINSGA